jgi:hypothetical protein
VLYNVNLVMRPRAVAPNQRAVYGIPAGFRYDTGFVANRVRYSSVVAEKFVYEAPGTFASGYFADINDVAVSQVSGRVFDAVNGLPPPARRDASTCWTLPCSKPRDL